MVPPPFVDLVCVINVWYKCKLVYVCEGQRRVLGIVYHSLSYAFEAGSLSAKLPLFI